MPTGIYKTNKGHIPWNKGKKGLQKHSIEHKKRISEMFKGRKLSEETKKKISLSQKGKHRLENKGSKSHLWKGGITPINQKIRTSLEYKLWREAVFERDNYTCIWCGARSRPGTKVILNADHIKPFSLYPELRFAIDNGRTLCLECHKKTNSYANKIKINYKL